MNRDPDNASPFLTKSRLFWLYFTIVHLVAILLLVASKDQIRQLVSQEKIDPRPKDYIVRQFHQFRVSRNLADDQWVFMGDSMTEGLNTSLVLEKSVNFGIGHDRTPWLLDRIQYYGGLSHNPLIIAVGINDILNNDFENSISMLKGFLASRSGKTKTIVLGVIPVSEERSIRQLEINEKVHQFNKDLVQMVAALTNVMYIPPPPSLINEAGSLLETVHDGDGLHLNELGYALWIRYLKAQLEAL